jgi:hypothetical protein
MRTTHFVRDHVMSQAQASQCITGAARHRVGVALRKKQSQCGGRADLTALTLGRNRDRTTRSQDDAVDVPALHARRDGINERERLLGVVTIGSGHLNSDPKQGTRFDRADRLDLSTTALVEVTSEEKDYPKFSA